MKENNKIIIVLTSVLFIVISISILLFNFYLNNNKNLRIGHAGGKFNNKSYPNSLAAINFNSKFTKYFELDLQLTKDNRLVCLHHPIIEDKNFSDIKDKIINENYCYDVTLKKFLDENKEIIIITDFKTDNIQGLNFIKKNFSNISSRFIPQIYREDEYKIVKNLGFERIIFTMYRVSSYSNKKIAKIIENMDLFAITMNPPRLRSGIMKLITKKDYFVYVYTVNSYLRFLQYKLFFDADEIYTDILF